MAYTSYKTRKSLGKRYDRDPAIGFEMERLNRVYAQLPQQNALELSKSQFAQKMEYDREQANLNRAAKAEAEGAAATSAMVGTIGNVAMTGATLRAMTKAPGEPFFGKTVSGMFGGDKATTGGIGTPTVRPPVSPARVDQGLSGGIGIQGDPGGALAPGDFAINMPGVAAGYSSGAVTPIVGSGGSGAMVNGMAVNMPGGTGGAAGIGLGGAAGAAGAGALGGKIAAVGYDAIAAGDNKNKATGAYLAGGALAGTAVAPGIGTVIGAAAGVLLAAVEDISGKVICTELYRQGLMDEETFLADQAFGRTLDTDVMVGYHAWALPVVELMRKSRVITWIVKHPALAWANHIAGKPNALGWALFTVGVPVCRFIGSLVRTREVSHG